MTVRIRRFVVEDHLHITLWMTACLSLMCFTTAAVAVFG